MVKKQELLLALKKVLPGIDTTSSTGDTFIFDNKWLKTGNSSLSISYKFPSNLGIKAAVKAKEFYKILNKMSEDIDIAMVGSKVIVKDTVTTLELSILEETDREIIDNKYLQNIEWKKIPTDFLEGLKKCAFSASTNMETGIWGTVFVGGKDIISSDSTRVSWFNMKKGIEGNFLLPLASVVEVINLKPDNMFVEENWVHFAKGDSDLINSARLVTGDYPIKELKNLFNREFKKTSYHFPEEIMDSINRVSILSFQEGYIKIHYDEKKGMLICEGEKEFAKIKDSIKIARKTFPLYKTMCISPKFFTDILPKTKQFFICDNLVLFEIDSFKHIVCLHTED